MASIADLVARFQRAPDGAFSQNEIDRLAQARSNVEAMKIAGLHLYRARDFTRCIELMERIVALQPNSENVTNFVVTLREARRPAEAVDALHRHGDHIEMITFHDL